MFLFIYSLLHYIETIGTAVKTYFVTENILCYKIKTITAPALQNGKIGKLVFH
jgi:hypothetical protein